MTDAQPRLGLNDIRPTDLQRGQQAPYERDPEKLRRQAFLAANRLSGHLRLVARRLPHPSTAE